METKAGFGSADLSVLQRVMGSINLGSCCDERLRELLASCGAGRRRIDGFETRVIREVKRRQAGPPRDGGGGGENGGGAGGGDGGGGGAGNDGAGNDGAGTDGAGNDGAGTDGAGTDAAGTDGAGTDGAGTDSSGGMDDQVRQGGGTSRREARRKIERAELADRFPILGRHLEDGLTNTENADAIAAALKRLTESERERLAALDGELATKAQLLPPEAFRRYLNKLMRNVADPPDGDSPSEAEKQTASSIFKMGRRHDGMWWLSGELDDERGTELNELIRQCAAALASGATVTDNTRAAALHHLATRIVSTPASTRTAGAGGGGQAHELAGDDGAGGTARGRARRHGGGRTTGGPAPSGSDGGGWSRGGHTGRAAAPSGGHGGRSRRGRRGGGESGAEGGRPARGPDHGTDFGRDVDPAGDEGLGLRLRMGIGYLIDTGTLAHGPHAGSVAQTWAGDDLDPRTATRLACDADCWAVVIDQLGRVGPVGRTRRTATRAQRLQLRALYDTCPLDEVTPFARCEIHHVNLPWEQGGETELDNLLPISRDWHHRIHDRGWRLAMHPDRSLTLCRPDGTVERRLPPPVPVTRRAY